MKNQLGFSSIFLILNSRSVSQVLGESRQGVQTGQHVRLRSERWHRALRHEGHAGRIDRRHRRLDATATLDPRGVGQADPALHKALHRRPGA